MIDPLPELQYFTYFGGNAYEMPYAFDWSEWGDMVCVGNTRSTDIATAGTHQTYFDGYPEDGYIVRFDAQDSLVWCTYYGGDGTDEIRKTTVTGAVISVTGETTSPTNIAFNPTASGTSQTQAFLGLFSLVDGTVFSSRYAGISSGGVSKRPDDTRVIAGMRPGNQAFIMNDVYEPTSSTTGAYLAVLDQNMYPVLGTYVTGNAGVTVEDIDTDSQGCVYLAGTTSNSESIATPGAFNDSLQDNDPYLMKFSPGLWPVWGTYFNMPYHLDKFQGIAVWGPDVYVLGQAYEGGVPTTPSSFLSETNGGGDAIDWDLFLAKFDTSGAFQWATYCSGEGNENFQDIWADSTGVYLVGNTGDVTCHSASTMDTTLENNNLDGFIRKFGRDGQRHWASFFGGPSGEWVNCIGRGPDGLLHFAGISSSPGLATPGSYQEVVIGSGDTYIARMTECFDPVDSLSGPILGPSTFCPGDTVVYSVQVDSEIPYYEWMVPLGTQILSGQFSPQITVRAGSSSGWVKVHGQNCCSSSPDVMLQLSILTTPSIGLSPEGDHSGCPGDSVLIIASGAATYLWSSGLASDSIYLMDEGEYHCLGTATNGCTASSDTISMVIAPVPITSINGPLDVDVGSTWSYYISSGSGNTYQWSVVGGNIVSGSDQTSVIQIEWPLLTLGTVIVSRTTSFPCTVSDTVQVNVGGAGIGEGPNRVVRLYPSPASDHIILDFGLSECGPFELVIVDGIGSEVFREYIPHANSQLRVDVRTLARGSYVLRLEGATNPLVFRFVK